MSNITGASNYFTTVSEPIISMQLTTTISGGAPLVPVTNINSQYPIGTVVALTINPSGINKQVFTGIVATNSVTNVVWTEGTNVSHTAGELIFDYVTATDFNLMSTGIRNTLSQSGTLKPGVVTTPALAPGSVTSVALAPSRTVDANGWVVHDYGTWKVYFYTPPVVNLTNAFGPQGGSYWTQTIASGIALPVGVSAASSLSWSVNGAFSPSGSPASPIIYQMTITGTGSAFDTSTGGTISIAANNPSSNTVAGGYIQVWLSATTR